MTPPNRASSSPEASRDRALALARSIYRQLRYEGLSPEQVFEISSALMDQVSEEIRQRADAERRG